MCDGPDVLARSSLLLLALGLTLFAGSAGCAAESELEASDSSAAFTVENGDRFVVSATPERIVLAKKVGDAAFPFDERSLRDKAILIHPVERKADDGVYARVLDVSSQGSKYVVDARPLTLEEMASITEDEIVRIYIDRKSTGKKTKEPGTVLSPATIHPLNGGTQVSGLAFSGFDLGSGVNFSSPFFLRPGVTFNHTIEHVSLEPDALVDWSWESGLELGFKADFEWKSKATISGKLSGEFFRSQTLEGPPLHGFVPIGPVAVPVTLQGKAHIKCSVAAAGPANITVDIAANAHLAASLRVAPQRGVAPTEWIHEGRWPAAASGGFSATSGLESTFSASVSCAVPRLEVHASVAGIAGPYLAMTPTIKLSGSGTTVETPIAAGVGAGMLGLGTGVEVTLYTWKP